MSAYEDLKTSLEANDQTIAMASILKFVSKDDRTTEEQVYPHLGPEYRRLQLLQIRSPCLGPDSA